MGIFGVLKTIYDSFCPPEESKLQPQPQSQPQHTQHRQHSQHPQHIQLPQHLHRPQRQRARKLHTQPQILYPKSNTPTDDHPHYTSLQARAAAKEHGYHMSRCFDESQQARARGEPTRAEELLNDGKEHKAKMHKLNRLASDLVFEENNKDNNPNRIDLHGLYVDEAIAHTDRAIKHAKQRGDSSVRLIVGKGLHSTTGPKVKPAIETFLKKHHLQVSLDPQNAGVLIVQLNTRQRRVVDEPGVDELPTETQTQTQTQTRRRTRRTGRTPANPSASSNHHAHAADDLEEADAEAEAEERYHHPPRENRDGKDPIERCANEADTADTERGIPIYENLRENLPRVGVLQSFLGAAVLGMTGYYAFNRSSREIRAGSSVTAGV
ncbi:hypothetical protein ONZ45_g14748 [Pleurotus djamor]|nr:hypothetical protein ONZ45_g14748 [Pleurotus djamor]